jgi:hypothetical protein
MTYRNIPEELRVLRQWVCWRLEDIGAAKPTKVPYDPKTGKRASVDEPESWTSFEEAVDISNNGYSGIGFVFTPSDSYAFIDLDNAEGNPLALAEQIKIAHEFNSYSERSPSNKGLHIIIKGKVPSGRRRNFIEIYSSLRYATFTGNVFNNKPIADYQDKLTELWERMGSGPATFIFNGDKEQKYSDDEIMKQAREATNGPKFLDLYNGDWQNFYQSQSEADFALVDIIAYYTQNKIQIDRIFHKSALGQRDKAKRRDYMAYMINRAFDRMLPKLDFDGFKNALDTKVAEQKELPLDGGTSFNGRTAPFDSANLGSNPSVPANPMSDFPPGLVGELAEYIYRAAPRPVKEIALAGAIALIAGVAGRAFNVSDPPTGLNQYIIILGMTGVGKEAAKTGIDYLMATAKSAVDVSGDFIGPAELTSGQAIVKYLNKSKTKSCIAMIGEFGLRLEQMSSQYASPANQTLKRMLLDLYTKSGYNQVLHPTIYADIDKNTEDIPSPALTILCESTPETFYGCISEQMIAEGLLPRFTIVEYKGWRPARNKNALINPPLWLIEKFTDFLQTCLQLISRNKSCNVRIDKESELLLDDFDKYADHQINNSGNEVMRQLWSRAHVKAMKIAAVIAVGINRIEPIIVPTNVLWAIAVVQQDILTMTKQFESGDVGYNNTEIRQNAEIVRVVKDYVTKPWGEVSKYAAKDDKKALVLYEKKIISYNYISRRLVAAGAFRNDRNGATFAIKRAIQSLLDGDRLREVQKKELANLCGTSQRAFVISDISLLD